MRAVAVGFVLVALAATASAQQKLHTSADGKFSVAFPGQPRETPKTAATAVGEVQVNVFTYANADGNAFMVSYSDFPAAATKPDNHKTLFDGVRDGIKGRDGKVAAGEKDFKLGELPGREFVVEKGKTRIKMRVVVSGNRVYQVAAIGTEKFANDEGTKFLDSFSITK